MIIKLTAYIGIADDDISYFEYYPKTNELLIITKQSNQRITFENNKGRNSAKEAFMNLSKHFGHELPDDFFE